MFAVVNKILTNFSTWNCSQGSNTRKRLVHQQQIQETPIRGVINYAYFLCELPIGPNSKLTKQCTLILCTRMYSEI